MGWSVTWRSATVEAERPNTTERDSPSGLLLCASSTGCDQEWYCGGSCAAVHVRAERGAYPSGARCEERVLGVPG